MTNGPRQLLRRLPLLVILLLLAWLFLGDRPREITLVYDLPDDPAPTRAEVKLLDREGKIPAQITWGTGQGPATDRQPHHARLTRGDYRLEATLEFPDGERRRIARGLAITPEDERIVIHLR